ncbi:MAG: CopG family transcriptional regulator [Armatimonadetes bacterium]|nr:CopG family transcriptional regulator [Armatimonadota bacterium]
MAVGRTALNLSVPGDMAEAYRALARERGVTASGLFREMFAAYRRQRLHTDLDRLQAAHSGPRISDEEVEALVFGDR